MNEINKWTLFLFFLSAKKVFLRLNLYVCVSVLQMFPCPSHVHHTRERFQLQKFLQSHQNSSDGAACQRAERDLRCSLRRPPCYLCSTQRRAQKFLRGWQTLSCYGTRDQQTGHVSCGILQWLKSNQCNTLW